MILAKYISPTAYGELNLFNTSVFLLTILVSLNSTGILSVNYFSSCRIELQQSLNSILIITLFVFGIILFSFIYFSAPLEVYTSLTVWQQIMALVICLFNVLSNINLDIWRLQDKIYKYGLFSMSMSILNCAFTLLFVISLGLDWIGRIYAQLLTCFIFFIISIVYLLKSEYLTLSLPPMKSLRETLRFGMPLIPHGISFWARQGLDRYIINFAYSQAAVGLFSFSFNFANIIQIIGAAFNASNSVFLYKKLSEDSKKTRAILYRQEKNVMIFFFVLTVLILGGCFIFIPIIIPQYSASMKYLFPLCFGAMFQCYYLLFVNYLFFYKRTKQLMYITFSISILHVSLSFWLTSYSILFTAYVNLLTNFLIAISVFIYSRKFCV